MVSFKGQLMKRILTIWLIGFAFSSLSAQSKDELRQEIARLKTDSFIQIEEIRNLKAEGSKLLSINRQLIFDSISLKRSFDSLNQIYNQNKLIFQTEISHCQTEMERLKSERNTLTLRYDSIAEQLKELSRMPRIDRENDWALIESHLKWTEKDCRNAIDWLTGVGSGDDKNIFTPTCYSFFADACDYYWGYPGSIEKEEFESKWKSKFDLKYSSFGHAFQNGNCGWASFRFKKIEFLGMLNGGDWYKLIIEGGCGENDYSQNLVRVVKLIEENGSFQIAYFISLKDE